MKVGDYVRTKKGTIYQFNSTSSKALSGVKKYMVKSSPKIIDLIQVGDYVNGHLVQEKYDDYVEIEETSGVNNDLPEIVKKEDIKSIVTKEMFSQIEYKVGE